MDAFDVKLIQTAFEILDQDNKNLKVALDNSNRILKISCEVLSILESKLGGQLEKPMVDYLQSLIALINETTKK